MNSLRSDIIVETSTPHGEWQTFTETITAAENEASLVLIFLVDGPGSIWVDDVKVKEVDNSSKISN
ncbi:MAG: hypothetical protein QNJ45_12605 [Ardenticatenaceae bacterium]|nr:hypothetical protein [Ardenticatenaceae bacterium]